MNRTIAAAAIAGTLLAGVGIGASALGPFSSIVEDSQAVDHARPAGWVGEAIDKLVEAGTINRSQGDAVLAALREARPAGPPRGGHGPGPGLRARMGLAAAAEAIGISEQDLAAALRGGRSMADVAREHDVDVAKVVDALVAEAEQHLDQAVKDGRIPEERAAQIREGIRERVTARVNGERPERHQG